jgi:hypothetical protein
MEDRGEVTVDTNSNDVCFEQQILGASSAHLHREDGETVVTFFEPPQDFRPSMCVTEVPDEALEEIASLTASPCARAYYDLQRSRGKNHNQALRALANRLVAILHGCLRHGQTYDESVAWPVGIRAAA